MSEEISIDSLKKWGPLKFRFCPFCGSGALKEIEVDGRSRSVCPDCGRVLYQNPIPSVVGISIKNDEILLVKRGVEPDIGTWCLPGGFMEMGETTKEAVIRELIEEAGVEVIPVNIITIDTALSGFYGDVVVIAYSIKVPEDALFTPGDDALEVKYFSKEDLPRLTFLSHAMIIEKAFGGE